MARKIMPFRLGVRVDERPEGGFVAVVIRKIGDGPPEEADVLDERGEVAVFATAEEAAEEAEDRVRLMLEYVRMRIEDLPGVELRLTGESEEESEG